MKTAFVALVAFVLGWVGGAFARAKSPGPETPVKTRMAPASSPYAFNVPSEEPITQSSTPPPRRASANQGLGLAHPRTVALSRQTPVDFLYMEKAPSADKVGELLGMDQDRRRSFATAYEDMSARLRSMEFARVRRSVTSSPHDVALEIPEFANAATPLLDEWITTLHHMLSPAESARYWSSGAHRALFVRGFGQVPGAYTLYSFENQLSASTACEDLSCTFTGFEYETVPEWLIPFRP